MKTLREIQEYAASQLPKDSAINCDGIDYTATCENFRNSDLGCSQCIFTLTATPEGNPVVLRMLEAIPDEVP
jgi:hypothetical protein